MIMDRMHKWWLLVICPIVAVLGSYLVLIAANCYYANRAAYLLERIRDLRLDSSGILELKRLGSEHGFLYKETSDCPRLCIYMASPNNEWMRTLLKSLSLSEIGKHIGLKPWVAVGDIEIENGQVIGKSYDLVFYQESGYPEIEVSVSDERELKVTPCVYYPLKRHPGYAFAKAGNIRSFRALVSPAGSLENRQNAFQFNLKCLTEWHQCNRFSELMPAAWADYEEDRKWSEMHPNNIVWDAGTKCPE